MECVVVCQPDCVTQGGGGREAFGPWQSWHGPTAFDCFARVCISGGMHGLMRKRLGTIRGVDLVGCSCMYLRGAIARCYRDTVGRLNVSRPLLGSAIESQLASGFAPIAAPKNSRSDSWVYLAGLVVTPQKDFWWETQDEGEQGVGCEAMVNVFSGRRSFWKTVFIIIPHATGTKHSGRLL